MATSAPEARAPPPQALSSLCPSHYHRAHLSNPAATVEKAMAPHSSTLTWKIPWTEEPGGLQSTGSLRVGHDWATSLSLFTFMHWRRKWQSTPMFLPGESQPGGLPSVGSHRVGHDWSALAAAAEAATVRHRGSRFFRSQRRRRYASSTARIPYCVCWGHSWHQSQSLQEPRSRGLHLNSHGQD